MIMRARYDEEVEDEYGDIMGAFVDEAEKDLLSQVGARAVTPPAPMAHDGFISTTSNRSATRLSTVAASELLCVARGRRAPSGVHSLCIMIRTNDAMSRNVGGYQSLLLFLS
jgi:hypothetical protein